MHRNLRAVYELFYVETDPTHPFVSVQADAASKMAANAPTFSRSRVYREMHGFDEPTVDRIMTDLDRAEGKALIADVMNGRA